MDRVPLKAKLFLKRKRKWEAVSLDRVPFGQSFLWTKSPLDRVPLEGKGEGKADKGRLLIKLVKDILFLKKGRDKGYIFLFKGH